jgi:small nuclear ribonucleoprotein
MSVKTLSSDNVLVQNIGKIVGVELRSKRCLRGKLILFDHHLNLVLADTKDVSNVKNVVELGFVIVRGSNVVLVLPNVVEMVS